MPSNNAKLIPFGALVFHPLRLNFLSLINAKALLIVCFAIGGCGQSYTTRLTPAHTDANSLLWWHVETHNPSDIAEALYLKKASLIERLGARTDPQEEDVKKLHDVVLKVQNTFNHCGFLPHHYLPFKNDPSCKNSFEYALTDMLFSSFGLTAPKYMGVSSLARRKKQIQGITDQVNDIRLQSFLAERMPSQVLIHQYVKNTATCSLLDLDSDSGNKFAGFPLPEESLIFEAGRHIRVGVLRADSLIAQSELAVPAEIVFSEALLYRFSDQPWALFGLVAHEMTHIRDGHAVLRAMLSPAFGCLGVGLKAPHIERGISMTIASCEVSSGRPGPCDLSPRSADLAIELMADFGAVLLIRRAQGDVTEYINAINVLFMEKEMLSAAIAPRLRCLRLLANDEDEKFFQCFMEVI